MRRTKLDEIFEDFDTLIINLILTIDLCPFTIRVIIGT